MSVPTLDDRRLAVLTQIELLLGGTLISQARERFGQGFALGFHDGDDIRDVLPGMDETDVARIEQRLKAR